jgi:hypothetical protein
VVALVKLVLTVAAGASDVRRARRRIERLRNIVEFLL